jgi:hypothetical protein
MIDDENFYLSPVVGIDGTRGIEEGHTRLHGKSAPRPDLGLIAGGERDRDPRGNQASLPGRRTASSSTAAKISIPAEIPSCSGEGEIFPVEPLDGNRHPVIQGHLSCSAVSCRPCRYR